MNHDDIQNYIKGRMTARDLKAAELHFATMSDEEIDRLLDASDNNNDSFQEDAERLHAQLLEEITPQRSPLSHFSFIRLMAVAAAVMIPLLLISTIYLIIRTNDFAKYESALGREIVVSTDKGESTKTILPDGTEISLGPESRITYRLASFNASERVVNFEGEATFEVVKDAKAPFTVDAPDFDIHVLGTGFSVLTRDDSGESQIYLAHGSIELESKQSDERVVMTPNQSAVINNTGDITIYTTADSPRLSVGNNVMYFSSAPLKELSRKIERYYGCPVIIEEGLEDLCFTGALPTDNLTETKYILRRALDIAVYVDNDERIVLSSNQ